MEVIENDRTGSFALFTADGFSIEDWARAERDRLGINVLGVPDGARNLAALRPAFHWLENLRVNSSSCDDLRLVSEMPKLRHLAIGGVVKQGVDERNLPALESFNGPYKNFPGIENLPSLQALGVEWRSDEVPSIAAPLKSLSIVERSASAGIPRLSHPDLLTDLEISFARRIDLHGAPTLARLGKLSLYRCASVTNSAELLLMDPLDSLVLEDCPSVEGYEALMDLRASLVRVIGRNPFGQSFRSEVAERSSANWIFPPGLRFMPNGF